MVFLMANQRSTRVQRICKKLQTVKGVGWPAAWSFFLAVRDFRERKGRPAGGEEGAFQMVLLEEVRRGEEQREL